MKLRLLMLFFVGFLGADVVRLSLGALIACVQGVCRKHSRGVTANSAAQTDIARLTVSQRDIHG